MVGLAYRLKVRQPTSDELRLKTRDACEQELPTVATRASCIVVGRLFEVGASAMMALRVGHQCQLVGTIGTDRRYVTWGPVLQCCQLSRTFFLHLPNVPGRLSATLSGSGGPHLLQGCLGSLSLGLGQWQAASLGGLQKERIVRYTRVSLLVSAALKARYC